MLSLPLSPPSPLLLSPLLNASSLTALPPSMVVNHLQGSPPSTSQTIHSREPLHSPGMEPLLPQLDVPILRSGSHASYFCMNCPYPAPFPSPGVNFERMFQPPGLCTQWSPQTLFHFSCCSQIEEDKAGKQAGKTRHQNVLLPEVGIWMTQIYINLLV